MKSAALLFGAALAAVIAAGGAGATTLWNNGAPGGQGDYCDSNTALCGGAGDGWTIYDQFTLTKASTITGITYNNGFTSSPSAYESSDISFWSSNPVTSWAAGPTESATAVGLVTPDGVGTDLITISGLNIALGAGTYWLGFQTITSDGSITVYDVSSLSGLPNASQSDNDGDFYNPSISPAAFTVEGVTSGVPEPAAWALMLTGLAGLGAALRVGRQKAVLA